MGVRRLAPLALWFWVLSAHATVPEGLDVTWREYVRNGETRHEATVTTRSNGLTYHLTSRSRTNIELTLRSMQMPRDPDHGLTLFHPDTNQPWHPFPEVRIRLGERPPLPPATPLAADPPAKATAAPRARSFHLPRTIATGGALVGTFTTMEGIAAGYLSVIDLSLRNDARIEKSIERWCRDDYDDSFTRWSTGVFPKAAGLRTGASLAPESYGRQLEAKFDEAFYKSVPDDWDRNHPDNQHELRAAKLGLVRATTGVTSLPIDDTAWNGLWDRATTKLMHAWFEEDTGWKCPWTKVHFRHDGARIEPGHAYPGYYRIANACTGELFSWQESPTAIVTRVAVTTPPRTLDDLETHAKASGYVVSGNESRETVARYRASRVPGNGAGCGGGRDGRARPAFGEGGYFSMPRLEPAHAYARRTTRPEPGCAEWRATMERLLDGDDAKLALMGGDQSKTVICRRLLNEPTYVYTTPDYGRSPSCSQAMDRVHDEVRFIYPGRRERPEVLACAERREGHDVFARLLARVQSALRAWEAKRWEGTTVISRLPLPDRRDHL